MWLVALVGMGWGLLGLETSSGGQSGAVRLSWPDGSFVLIPPDKAGDLVLHEHEVAPSVPLPDGFAQVGPLREIGGTTVLLEIALCCPERIEESEDAGGRLRMFRFDEVRGAWELLNAEIRGGDRRVVARSDRTGVFALGRTAKAFATDFRDVRVYPNPFKPNDGDPDTGSCAGGVTIDQLPPGMQSIEIYDLSGMLVAGMGKGIAYDGARDRATWGCSNDDGELVVSGIYVLAMENQDGEQWTAKIGVIR